MSTNSSASGAWANTRVWTSVDFPSHRTDSVAILPTDPLSPSRSRALVVTMVALIALLSIVATLMITRGWDNDTVQTRVEQQENERRTQMPRLDD